MDLYKEEIYSIFAKNFAFPIVDTILGKAIKMDAISAFLFANVTGAGYLDNPTFLFSPKGTQKTLREAFQYNLVTGIFNETSLFYSPAELKHKRPYIFSGDKFVVFKEFVNECDLSEELQDDYDNILDSGGQPTDYIIGRIEASKSGNGLEPFLEYLACEHFKRKGYVVENQVPLAATVGSPDFGGYKIKGSDNGFHINELSLLRFTRNFGIIQELIITDVIVGEAKTSTTIMEKQVRKYMNTGLFSCAYELHPDKAAPSNNSFGLMNLDSNYSVQLQEPLAKYAGGTKSDYSKQDYCLWITNYFKFYLMANFTKAEFDEIMRNKTGKAKWQSGDIISVILKMPVEDIVKRIREVA